MVPLFALANAGVPLDADALSRALTSPITLGVILGLVAGKALGITVVSLSAVRLGAGHLPRGCAPPPGVGLRAGRHRLHGVVVRRRSGLRSQALRDEAKVGVLAASALAAALGWVLFRALGARDPTTREPSGHRLDPPSDTRNDHHRGRAGAPVTLVEFGDYSCPHTRAAEPQVSELQEEFGDRLDVVFRHLPNEDAHPDAPLAAEAAEATAPRDGSGRCMTGSWQTSTPCRRPS